MLPACSQLASLTRLHDLSLHHLPFPSSGYSPLAELGSLRRLKLTECKLPGSLPQLTWLEALQISDLTDAAASWEALEAGLQPLAGLTHLTIEPRGSLLPLACPRIPPTLQGLTSLRRLYWGADVAAPQNPALPAGPWLSTLRQFALPLEMAAANLRLLQSAVPQLVWLGITRWRRRAGSSASGWEGRMLRSLLRSAGQQATGSLRTVRVDFGDPLGGDEPNPPLPWWAEEAAALRSRGLLLESGTAKPSIQRLRCRGPVNQTVSCPVQFGPFHTSCPALHFSPAFPGAALPFHASIVHAQQFE